MPIPSWHELIITCPDDAREAVTGVLYEHGCVGVAEEADALRAYFPMDVRIEEVTAALSALGVTCERAVVEEDDWLRPWKEGYGPVRVAGLLICPPWKLDACAPAPDEKLLVLDPGQAFGTGEHVTTMGVLTMLRDWAGSQAGLASKRLLDLGTGTGILAIAAWLYGIRDITAVDTEPRAVEGAGRNLAHNGLVGKVRLMPGSMVDAGRGYDIILANLHQEALLEVMPDMASALNPGGVIVASGLLEGQEPPVVALAKRHGLRPVRVERPGGWVSLMLA